MGTNPYLLQSSIKGGFYEKIICLQLGACCDSFGMFFCAFYPFRGWNFDTDHDHGRGKYCNRRWCGWDLAIQRFPEIQANAEVFQAILAHNGLSGVTTFADEQKLLIYGEYKKLNA